MKDLLFSFVTEPEDGLLPPDRLLFTCLLTFPEPTLLLRGVSLPGEDGVVSSACSAISLDVSSLLLRLDLTVVDSDEEEDEEAREGEASML